MAGKGVHPGYAHLQDSIMTSEVLASKYANEITKAGYEGDKDDIINHMEQLDGILKESGVVISDEVLEMFAEITVYLGNQGKTELMGKVPIAICKLHKNSIQDQTRAITYVEKLKSLTEELSDQVTDLKRTSITMKAVLPRLKIKAKRTTGTIEKLEKKGKNKEVPMEMDKPRPEEQKGSNSSPESPEPATSQHGPSNPVAAFITDPETNIAKRMRDSYRQYYSSASFSTLPHEQQVALIEYYMAHILRVAWEEYEDDAEIYNMFSDLIDKDRMIAYCKLAEDEELTSDMIDDAIDEMIDIINACSPAYGKYYVEVREKNDMSILYIRSM